MYNDNEERSMPYYFKTYEAHMEYQMGELMKDIDPNMLGIEMLWNYKRSWENVETTEEL